MAIRPLVPFFLLARLFFSYCYLEVLYIFIILFFQSKYVAYMFKCILKNINSSMPLLSLKLHQSPPTALRIKSKLPVVE
jgi:hypothetical protein